MHAFHIQKLLAPQSPFWISIYNFNQLEFLLWLSTTSNERDLHFYIFPEVFSNNFQSNNCLHGSKIVLLKFQWPNW